MLLADLKQYFLDIYAIDLEEGVNEKIIAQCVKKISEEYPNTEQNFTLTVAGQNNYQVSHNGLIKLTEVYYSTTYSPEFVNSYDYSTSNSISLQFTEIYERELREKLNPSGANIYSHDKFELVPPPTQSDIKVYYEYESYRSLEEIPEIFQDDLIRLFFYYERENSFRSSLRVNNGNQFKFDRRGNIQDTSDSSQSETVKREEEYSNIIKSIRNTVMKIKR